MHHHMYPTSKRWITIANLLDILFTHKLPEDVNITVGARVRGEDIMIRDDDDTLTIPHLQMSIVRSPYIWTQEGNNGGGRGFRCQGSCCHSSSLVHHM